MKAPSFERQRKAKIIFAVLTVGVAVSALVGVMLFFMGRIHPRF
jgi:hypothetical protein